MTDQIQVDDFTKVIYELLDETFDNVQGYYLDKGSSLFETLADVSAAEASVPVGGKCATLAAQAKHVAFYLDVLEQSLRAQKFERQDWGKIWRETNTVTPEEWDEIKATLRESYNRVKAYIAEPADWAGDMQIGGVIAIVVHTAYHLGEIRQALCTIKN